MRTTRPPQPRRASPSVASLGSSFARLALVAAALAGCGAGAPVLVDAGRDLDPDPVDAPPLHLRATRDLSSAPERRDLYASCDASALRVVDGRPTPNEVACGGQPCMLPDGCCIAPMANTFTCGTTCAQQSFWRCDGPEDCGTERCCTNFGPPSVASTSCGPSCDQYIVCHTHADCPNAGDACIHFMPLPSGSGVCRHMMCH